jgi:hypothetical protein
VSIWRESEPGNAGGQRYLSLNYGHRTKIRAEQGVRRSSKYVREGSGNHFSACAALAPENTTLQDDLRGSTGESPRSRGQVMG